MFKKHFLITVILIGSALILSGCSITPISSDTDKSDLVRPQTSVTWCITQPSKSRICYDAVVTNYGDSAYASLQKLDERESTFTFKSQGYEESGYFVTGIDGTENSADKSWYLYRNGVRTTAPISQVKVENNDELEFKYEDIK
jgi:hypothetical protein